MPQFLVLAGVMFASDQYQLLDYGEGRKLERYGPYVIDRPAPAGEGVRKSKRNLWQAADARFERSGEQAGCWLPANALPESWLVEHGSLTFELRPTPFGHVGLFPEQAVNWDWLFDRVSRARRQLKILNLFAYTGGATLACAAAGAQVVHVDAARNIVQWARRNSAASGLAEAPIRWIVEDAARFVRRELQRRNTYDAIVLDPPSYGHGPRGESWKFAEDLLPLLADCRKLTRPRMEFLLLTCHTPGWDVARIGRILGAAGVHHAFVEPLVLEAVDGRELPSGLAARFLGTPTP